jgi:hypothetical protein
MKVEHLSLVISVIALGASALSYLHERKTFIFSSASERAAAVKEAWGKHPKSNTHSIIEDNQWMYWSPIVSEIVSTIIILEKLTGRWKLIRRFLSINDFYIVFWEQIPTDLRTAIEKYKESMDTTQIDEQITFRKQMKTILKTYYR